MKIIYRTSPHGYEKEKIATKLKCLISFFRFVMNSSDSMLIRVDNGTPAFVREVQSVAEKFRLAAGPSVVIEGTSIGSSGGSFRSALDYVLGKNLPEDEPIYFAEDDYIYRKGARAALLDGLRFGKFVTAYDHPDKYLPASKGGNPFVGEDGGQATRLFAGRQCHFRAVDSTTLTFLTTAGALERFAPAFRAHCSAEYPQDFRAWLDIRKRGGMLVSTVPAFSTHAERLWLAPFVDWEEVLSNL